MHIYYRYLSLIALSCISLAVHAMQDLGQRLINSAFNGDIQKVQEFIDKGADVNAQDKHGATALMESAFYGYKDMAELLLKHGADVNVQDEDGITALMSAILNKHKAIVELLLKYDADVSIKDNDNKTFRYCKKYVANRYISQEEKAEYKEIGRMLLEAYIKQKRLEGAQQAGKRALLQQIVEYKDASGAYLFPQEIIDMISKEMSK